METAFYIMWYVFMFIFGTVIFSFLNVVIYRTPLKDTNFTKGRSFCPKCGHSLAWYDLFPLFSWIFLGGKCRYCKAKISKRYPLVEALGGIMSVLCVWMFIDPMELSGMDIFRAFTAFALCCMMTVICFIDWDTMTIFDSTNIVVAVIGVISYFAFPEVGIVSRIIGAFCISLPMYIIVLVKEGAFGGGDIKLFFGLGIFFGWKLVLFIFFVAAVTGGLYAAVGMAMKTKKGKDHFAFGPYICFGAVLALFAGNAILDWYLSMFQFEITP